VARGGGGGGGGETRVNILRGQKNSRRRAHNDIITYS